ncbi:MAG: hypothetical protein HZB53_05455 [Chloroflexi bacterium]|nr:hypothetical protein [Chloroflexota bacterium]
MSIAQSFVTCLCMSGMIGAMALMMLVMGIFRRGAEGLDDAAANMLKAGGLIILALLVALWVWAWPRIPPGTLEKLLR